VHSGATAEGAIDKEALAAVRAGAKRPGSESEMSSTTVHVGTYYRYIAECQDWPMCTHVSVLQRATPGDVSLSR
jgi:hypothetical protein